MRISDTERREAARKLREIERQTLCELTDGELIDFLVEAVGFNRYTNEDFDEGLLGLIAELVDRPTCKNSEYLYDGSFFECSKCGERWELTCGSQADNNLNFCPRCGAEVVE